MGGLEVGDHRLLAELEAVHVIGRPWCKGPEPELIQDTASGPGDDAFHQLLLRPHDGDDHTGSLGSTNGLPHGRYVVRNGNGDAICGTEVLGALPRRLVCGSPWAAAGCQAEFGTMLECLQRRARKPMASVLADARDSRWQALYGGMALPRVGLWSSRKRPGIAITGIPVNLTAEEQATLARVPIVVPWEFMPFHAGRLVLI